MSKLLLIEKKKKHYKQQRSDITFQVLQDNFRQLKLLQESVDTLSSEESDLSADEDEEEDGEGDEENIEQKEEKIKQKLAAKQAREDAIQAKVADMLDVAKVLVVHRWIFLTKLYIHTVTVLRCKCYSVNEVLQFAVLVNFTCKLLKGYLPFWYKTHLHRS